MLLTGELSLDGKASLLLCPFGRKSNNESCQYFDVSILCFFWLSETSLILVLPEMFALAVLFFS